MLLASPCPLLRVMLPHQMLAVVPIWKMKVASGVCRVQKNWLAFVTDISCSSYFVGENSREMFWDVCGGGMFDEDGCYEASTG